MLKKTLKLESKLELTKGIALVCALTDEQVFALYQLKKYQTILHFVR